MRNVQYSVVVKGKRFARFLLFGVNFCCSMLNIKSLSLLNIIIRDDVVGRLLLCSLFIKNMLNEIYSLPP